MYRQDDNNIYTLVLRDHADRDIESIHQDTRDCAQVYLDSREVSRCDEEVQGNVTIWYVLMIHGNTMNQNEIINCYYKVNTNRTPLPCGENTTATVVVTNGQGG